MSKLLIEDRPLMVLPSLAVAIGLNEAIILQQLHWWLDKSANVIDGHSWVYNTYSQWQEQFPFWSDKTIRRAIGTLESKGLVVSTSEYNKMGIDKTKWYRIDYDKLNLVSSPSGQNDQSSWSNCPHPSGQNDQTNNHRVPKSTTKKYIYYLEHVKMTEDEYDKLLEIMSEKEREDYMERFNVWITGQTKTVQKNRNAYLTIRKWFKDNESKKKPSQVEYLKSQNPVIDEQEEMERKQAYERLRQRAQTT